MTKLPYMAVAVLLLVACGPKKQYVITSMTGAYLPVTKTNGGSEEMADFIGFYTEILDREMNKPVGHSAQYMTTGRPESLLTNLTSDFMLDLDPSYNDGHPIDIAFMNVHGIRAPIAEGEITVGDIFDTYPFDNTLVIVQLKGKYLTELFKSYANMGGAGLSKNMKLIIKGNKLQEALIGGEPVDESKIYTIITLDYLAEGNDGMDALKNAESVKQTGVTLRDYMLDNIRRLEGQGQKLASSLDGRITIVK